MTWGGEREDAHHHLVFGNAVAHGSRNATETHPIRMHTFTLLAWVFGFCVRAQNSTWESSRLWSNSPARYYNSTYLIGNGRVGAGIGGGVRSEIMSVNEDSFWSGGFINRTNPDALNYMPQMQSLVKEGRFLEAQRLASFAYVGNPVSTRVFEALGEFIMNMNHTDSATEYQRYLDVADSTVGVTYINDGVRYTREYIASNADDVVAIKISTDKAASVSLQVKLRRSLQDDLDRYQDYSISNKIDTIYTGGHSASATGIEFSAGARVIAKGGRVYTVGDYVFCDNADEAWIYFTAWTSFRKQDPLATVKTDLAAVRSYPEVRKAHVDDYQNLLNRVELSFGKSTEEQRKMTTAQRIENLSKTFDPELVSLYFQFGRYLLISSSRKGTLPANLQGLWSPDPTPYWGSKYTTNINIQMNYWPALITNLEELTDPLHSLIEDVLARGSDVAKKMYGVERGFVCHHNTDLWGDSAPQDNYAASTWWPTAGPWLTFHLMEYYRYTGDTNFLEKYYPTLKAAAEFFADFVTDYKGYKVVNPSMSPENQFYIPGSNNTAAISLGSTIDNSLLRELFREIEEIKHILKLENEGDFVDELKAIDSKLPPLGVNYYGGLREWIEDYKEVSTGLL